MSCGDYEGLIALRVGGDLPREDEGRLDGHLAGCSACRQFAQEFQECQNALILWRSGAPDADLMENVRRNVLARIKEGRGRSIGSWRLQLPIFRFFLRFAAGVAITSLLVGSFWLARHRRPPGREVQPPSRPSAASLSPGAADPRRETQTHAIAQAGTVPKRKARLTASAPRDSRAGQREPVEKMGELDTSALKPLRIELQTADPNIRIIWFVPQRSE
jgi:hypothetical protein